MKKKTTFIYLCVYTCFIGGFLFWFYNIRLNESELHKIETKIENNKEVNKYLFNPSFSKDGNHEVFSFKGLKSYPYHFIATTNQDFNNLSNEKKYKVFIQVSNMIDKDGMGLVKCGYKKYCSITEIQFFIMDKSDKLKENYFTYNIANQEITHSFDNENRMSQTEILSRENDDNQLEIIEKSGTIDRGYIYISGSIKNNSKTPLSNVEIKVTYFDDNENIIDTDHIYLNDPILPNEQNSFTIMTQMMPGQSYSTYKVEVVNYYIMI